MYVVYYRTGTPENFQWVLDPGKHKKAIDAIMARDKYMYSGKAAFYENDTVFEQIGLPTTWDAM